MRPVVESRALSWRETTAAGGLALVGTLSAINLLDYATSAALSVVGPEVQRSLHLSDQGLGVVASLAGVTFVVGAVPIGFLGDRIRRTTITAVCTAIAGLATMLTGAVHAVWQLAMLRLLTGAGQSSILPVNSSLLADGYPLRSRERVFALHNAMPSLGYVLGPVAAALAAGLAGGSAGWRWSFVALGASGLACAVFAARLREPTRGRGELAEVVGEEAADAMLAARLQDVPVAFGPAVRRLVSVRTMSTVLVAIGVLGFSLVSVPTYFGLLLDRRYGLGPIDRGYAVAATEVIAVVGVLVGASIGGRGLREDPRRAMALVAMATAGFAVVLPLGLYLPGGVPVVLVGVGLAKALLSVSTVPVYLLVAAVVPTRLRTLGFALLGLYVLLLGGLLGNVITGAISDSHGPRFALVAVSVPASLLAAAVTLQGRRFVVGDMQRAADELAAEQAEQAEVLAGGEVPVLQVRGLNAGYGDVQVLFGIDLEVREGEVLALLGTNGAGKSTLLRALSGLITPTRGTIRVDGRLATFSDPGARVRLGLVQVPGGRAVFPGLSVADNLRAGAYTFGWDNATVRERVAEVLELLPALAGRMQQRAGSLSGGEQQMLAIGKALLLRPRILLVDELSLGLAPAVVAQMLDVVDALRAKGMTMVLVEQSVNVALSVADRAVFLEKGEIRFSGPAAELLERDDLARAVFLGAAAR